MEFTYTYVKYAWKHSNDCFMKTLTVSVWADFQVCQPCRDLVFSLCICEVKSIVASLLHAVADEPESVKTTDGTKVVATDCSGHSVLLWRQCLCPKSTLLCPSGVLAEDNGVSHHDQQGSRPGHSHVESLQRPHGQDTMILLKNLNVFKFELTENGPKNSLKLEDFMNSK